MAWNSRQTKTAASNVTAVKAGVGVGAPVSANPGLIGKPYRDSWDIERAYREGPQKITWVFRAIDAIAGNQARLPIVLREDNSPFGKLVDGEDDLKEVLNSQSNEGENAFIFRYRLSAQLLMSTRGVFIEQIRGRDGRLLGLQLLPPQHTAPIPDPRKFVAGYEVHLPGQQKQILKPEQVIWVRRPHPLNPYLSLTPMESAGFAIEIENLAKLYNRNFLLNDGRPGGLLVVRGEMDEDDKDELRSRFRGNMARAGMTTVIASEDGVDYVDTSASPRDAAYLEMRNLTKEEILAAFGVPESVIGNAAGRTFSNAAEEIRVFWLETMLPHLEPLARSLDQLHPKYYVDFDTSQVPILIIAKQERERYLLDEFNAGLISGNEYRVGTGREKIKSELMDAMLANPNLTPIGNTEKEFKPEEQQPVDMIGAEGAPTGPPGLPGGGSPPAPDMGNGAMGAPPAPDAAPVEAPKSAYGYSVKMDTTVLDGWDRKAEQSADRWVQILDRSLERLFERQQRVVLEKASGQKARRALEAGTLTVDAVFDKSVWDRQIVEDIRPVIAAIVTDGANSVAEQSGTPVDATSDEFQQYVDQQTERVQKANETTKEEITAALLVALALLGGDSERHPMFKVALGAVFANLLGPRRRKIAEHEAQSAYNAGTYLAAQSVLVAQGDETGRAAERASRRGEAAAAAAGAGAAAGDNGDRPGVPGGTVTKTWVTRHDDRVRSAHRVLHNTTVPLGEGFVTDGHVLRFPGDPAAPPELTINCRCYLRFGFDQ